MVALQKPATVCIVDNRPSDYRRLANEVRDRMARIVFFRTGHEALQAASRSDATVWIINLQLPDMSGVDLQTMLRTRGTPTRTILLSDEYSVDDELAARTTAAMYCAKPVPTEWVEACC